MFGAGVGSRLPCCTQRKLNLPVAVQDEGLNLPQNPQLCHWRALNKGMLDREERGLGKDDKGGCRSPMPGGRWGTLSLDTKCGCGELTSPTCELAPSPAAGNPPSSLLAITAEDERVLKRVEVVEMLQLQHINPQPYKTQGRGERAPSQEESTEVGSQRLLGPALLPASCSRCGNPVCASGGQRGV